jgi:hypothetical protein
MARLRPAARRLLVSLAGRYSRLDGGTRQVSLAEALERGLAHLDGHVSDEELRQQ